MIQHLPKKMTPEIVELARWCRDNLDVKWPGTIPIACIDHDAVAKDHRDGIFRFSPDGVPPHSSIDMVPNLTRWETYGVLRGALAGMDGLAEVSWVFSDDAGSPLWMVDLDRGGMHAIGPEPTMIEAVIAAIRLHVEDKETP